MRSCGGSTGHSVSMVMCDQNNSTVAVNIEMLIQCTFSSPFSLADLQSTPAEVYKVYDDCMLPFEVQVCSMHVAFIRFIFKYVNCV